MYNAFIQYYNYIYYILYNIILSCITWLWATETMPYFPSFYPLQAKFTLYHTAVWNWHLTLYLLYWSIYLLIISTVVTLRINENLTFFHESPLVCSKENVKTRNNSDQLSFIFLPSISMLKSTLVRPTTYTCASYWLKGALERLEMTGTI